MDRMGSEGLGCHPCHTRVIALQQEILLDTCDGEARRESNRCHPVSPTHLPGVALQCTRSEMHGRPWLPAQFSSFGRVRQACRRPALRLPTLHRQCVMVACVCEFSTYGAGGPSVFSTWIKSEVNLTTQDSLSGSVGKRPHSCVAGYLITL